MTTPHGQILQPWHTSNQYRKNHETQNQQSSLVDHSNSSLLFPPRDEPLYRDQAGGHELANDYDKSLSSSVNDQSNHKVYDYRPKYNQGKAIDERGYANFKAFNRNGYLDNDTIDNYRRANPKVDNEWQ